MTEAAAAAAGQSSHIVSYRGMVADGVCHLGGRVVRRPLLGGPREDDGWWQNMVNTYRRLDSEFIAGATAARAKLEHVGTLVQRYSALQWVLMGDSGQLDAELYAQIVRSFPGRIRAIYIRDVDPALASPRDRFIDGYIGSIADTQVPMVRVANSNAIAEHAHSLGLIDAAQIPKVAAEVVKDQARTPLLQAVVTGEGPKAN